MAPNQSQVQANQAAILAPKPTFEPGAGWIMQQWEDSCDMPIHPHLHQTRPSRLSTDPRAATPGFNPTTTSAQVNSTLFNTTLAHYRTGLYKLLDSERWGHVNTTTQLKSEVSRRECAENEVKELRKGFASLEFSLKSSSKTISELTSERFDLHQEIARLRTELSRRQNQYKDLVFKHENDLEDVQVAFQQHVFQEAESRGGSHGSNNARQAITATVSPLDILRG